MKNLWRYILLLGLLIAAGSPYAQSVRIGGSVSSIAKSGSTALIGDVTLTGGTNVTLTQTGQDISIAATGGGGGGNVNAGGTLTSGLPVIGQGSTDVAVGTRSGNTTKYVSMDGSSPATNDCAKWDASGNLTTAGAACGGGGGGSTIYAARIGRTAAQSIPNNTVTAITFDTEACTGCYDTTTLHDNSTNPERITIPAAASCTVGGMVSYASNSGGSFRSLYIYLNGSGGTLLALGQREQGSGSNQFSLGGINVDIMAGFHAAANDYIELHAYQDSGSSLNISQASYTPTFWINCVAD